ncbi:MAG: tetratricopeptide repeat protein [Treponematales bacterium]
MRILAAGLAALAAFGAASCASTGSAGDGLTLQKAVEQAAAGISEKLPPKTRVAIVNFDSESPELSEYVMAELEAALYDNGVADIADRHNLDFVRKELNLQISGEVDDKTAQSIGKFWGAQSIVTGEMVNTGDGYRFRLSVVNVETAAREGSTRFNVRRDRNFKKLIAALGKGEGPAVTVAEAKEKAASQSAGAFLDRGIAAAVRRDWNTAIAEFTGALRLDPNYAAAYLLRGMAMLASVSNVTDISENFEDFASLSETFSETEKPVANRAIDDLTEAIGLTPTVKTYLYRGSVYIGLGEYDKAIVDYTEAIRLDPNAADAYNNRGVAYVEKGDNNKAIVDFNQALRLFPNYANAYNNRDAAYDDKGDYDRAIADYTQAIRLDPDYAYPYTNRGDAYRDKGDYDRAIADYTQAIRLDPNNGYAYISRGNAYKNRGITYGDKGDYDRAIADFNQALKLAPDNAAALYNSRGWNYALKGDYKRALEDANKSLELRPNDANTLDTRATAYQGLGDLNRAIADWEAAVKLAPDNTTFRENLEKAKKARGR